VDKGIYAASALTLVSLVTRFKVDRYHRDLDNQLNAIFLYSLDTHKFTQSLTA